MTRFDKFYDDYDRGTWCISAVGYKGVIVGDVLISDLTTQQADDTLKALNGLADALTAAEAEISKQVDGAHAWHQVALAAEAERDRLASLVDAAMQSDCAFDDDVSPRTCFVHNGEWPSLERPCEWVIEGNDILTKMGERARGAAHDARRQP